MDMSITEKRKNLRARKNVMRGISLYFTFAKIGCAFIALAKLLESDLNVATNPGVGSFLISLGVCGFLFSSIISLMADFN